MDATHCQHCGGEDFRQDGKMKGKQRYLCRGCQRTFSVRSGNNDRAIEQKLAVLLDATGKASFRYLGKLFHICAATAINSVKR